MNYINILTDAMLTSGIAIPALMMGFYLSRRYIMSCIIPIIIFALIDHFLVKTLYIIQGINGNFSALKNYTWPDALISGIVPDIIAFILISLIFFYLSKMLRKIKF